MTEWIEYITKTIKNDNGEYMVKIPFEFWGRRRIEPNDPIVVRLGCIDVFEEKKEMEA